MPLSLTRSFISDKNLNSSFHCARDASENPFFEARIKRLERQPGSAPAECAQIVNHPLINKNLAVLFFSIYI